MKKINNRLQGLQRRKSPVLVGEEELLVRTFTLKQQRDFFEALKRVDFEPIAKVLGEIFATAEDPQAFLRTIVQEGANVWSTITETLATNATDSLALAAAVALDHETNFNALSKSGKPLVEIEPERGSFDVYLECDELKEWVGLVISPEQAIDIVREAISVSAYAELGKALKDLVMSQIPKVETVTMDDGATVKMG